ncbi:hypothetical protein JKG68_26075 [Microvirga aerilata]|uniref:Uncharacterized protein n=1 Tax=Microvirga aerilata TaxID=670292 RepID=A0A936ZB04_9HYPH|nr:hypothetical protein [Microvirga aerilata]MBL0407391.1 hypothetical protein [Microvirga aerilata]
MESGKIDPLVSQMTAKLKAEHGDVNVQVRETGRYMRALIEPHDRPYASGERAKALIGEEDAWQLIEAAVEQREDAPDRT